MNATEIKKKMMGLWENVFHDTKEYISLLFDNYFNPEYVEFEETDGRITAALLGIPYEFTKGRNNLKGLFLCAVSSSENFRQQGLMTGLIERVNNRFKEEFDFTFLIPMNDLKADYFHQQGYFNAFYRVEERYTSVHDFKNDFIVTLSDSDERIKELKKNLFEEIKVIDYYNGVMFSQYDIIDFIRERENKNGQIVNLIHTEQEISNIIRENEIKGGSIFVAYDKEGKITGVAFIVKEEIKRIGIPAIYVTDNCSYYSLLNHIKLKFSDYSISLYKNTDSAEALSLSEQVYGAENPDGLDLETLFGLIDRPFNLSQNMQPYGMVKLLRFDNILKFIAETHKEASFRIWLKDYPNSEPPILYNISKGCIREEKFDPSENSKNILRLTTKELSELLLRKRDSSSLIMEAFGIPRLVLKMALMIE